MMRRPLLLLAVILPLLAGLSAHAETPAAAVEGFRSAKFGMDEAAVRKAIAADFGLKDDKVRRDTHPTEKTTVLTIQVADLLPETGPAAVSYILGYQSHALGQVNIAWLGKDEAMAAGAMTLRDHFLAQGFPANAVVRDVQLAEGTVLAFRGLDAKGRMVMVVYQAPPKAAAGQEQPPSVLRLSYVQAPETPDVFRLNPGQF